MPLIKIDEDTYINSDQIIMICADDNFMPVADGYKRIWFSNGLLRDIPDNVALYIAQALDANEAFTNQQPAEMSLASRIAAFLRNQSAGVSLTRLRVEFGDSEELQAALNELDANNVIHSLGTDDDSILYYHASNPIFAGPEETEF